MEWSHFGLPEWSVGLPDGWRALFSFSAASLVTLASAVRAKAVHPSVLDRLVCSRHWEWNQSSPVQNPVTHEEFARDGNAIYVVSCCCLRTETAWLERNIGTFFFSWAAWNTLKEKIPRAMICRSEIIRLQQSIHTAHSNSLGIVYSFWRILLAIFSIPCN